MACVYKITSPTNKVYVGSTSDITRRWRSYNKMRCKSQRKLYSSFLKYGVDKHNFEIITECELDCMLQIETHWGLFYNVLDKKAGLNLRLPKDGEVYGGFSKERVCSGDFKKGQIPWNKGISCEDEIKLKISNTKKGKPSWNKGKPWSEEAKNNMSKGSKGKPTWNKGKKTNQLTHNAKLVLCLNTGVFYYSSTQASDAYNYKRTTLQAMLNGQNPNTSNLKYV